MSFAVKYSKLMTTRVNNVCKFGGYISRGMASVKDFHIDWKRPERIPLSDVKQSGDLGLDIKVDPSEIKLHYQNSKELEGASDLVRRMFSVELQPQKESRNLKREKIMALVKRHICDRGSVESRIAAMTSEIYDLQKNMQEHPYNKKCKVFLKEMIEKRRKTLRLLRTWDYRRFEWVLERLNLVYLPQPLKVGCVSRKESITRMTQSFIDDMKQTKLNAYKNELREQQKVFYAQKADQLAFILKEEIECGLTPTVTVEDIEEARKKVKELTESKDV